MSDGISGEGAQARPIGLATLEDLPAMISSLSAAFADDPGLAWIWPDRAERLQRLPYFFEAVVAGTVTYGIVLHASDSAAVSLWRRPGAICPRPEEVQLGLPAMTKAVGSGRARLKMLGEATKAHQPAHSAWWYLQFIGVRPSAQGTGLGGAAVRTGIELARVVDQPVWVEVMNPENLGYYQHIGFETVNEYDLPEGGPHVWGMMFRA